MRRHRPPSRQKATPEKLGEVFLAAHGESTPGAALQADDPRLSAGSGVPTSRVITTTSPVRIDGGASADLSADRTLSVNAATTGAAGVVELATDGESAANVVVQGNDSRNSNARTPTGAAGGDLTGTYPNPTLSTATTSGLLRGLSGRWIYGPGFEGALTLVADTTWANGDNVHSFTDVDTAGFTLTYNASDSNGVIYASGTVSGGGRISAKGKSASTGGTGGSCNANNPNIAAGAGGDGSGAFYVFARVIDNVTIDADGMDGAALTALSAADALAAGSIGNAGATATSVNLFSVAYSISAADPGGGGSMADSGGAGGAGAEMTSAANIDANRRTLYDIQRMVFGIVSPFVDTATSDPRHFRSTGGAGGGGGAGNTGGPSIFRGGGGGGGGRGIWGDGGDGSASDAGNSATNFVCGNGSGGGGGGGKAYLFCESATSVTVTATGGDALSGQTGLNGASNGGRGGGGGGGVAFAVYSGSGVTLASGGGAGGNNGSAGLTYDLPR